MTIRSSQISHWCLSKGENWVQTDSSCSKWCFKQEIVFVVWLWIVTFVFLFFQTVMNAMRTLVYVILVSASTRWGATAASAPTASKQRGTSPCVSVSCDGSVLTCVWHVLWALSEVKLWLTFQTWTSVRDNPVATGPVRTQWAPTTVCATPAFRTLTTETA